MAMFAQRVSNARECAGTTCAVLARLEIGTRVDVVGQVAGEVFRESDQWYQVRLGDGREAFVHTSLLGPPVVQAEVTQAISAPPSAPVSVPQSQPVSGGFPDNCDEAVAMGLSAQEAAQYDHLDRDGDGVACYGD